MEFFLKMCTWMVNNLAMRWLNWKCHHHWSVCVYVAQCVHFSRTGTNTNPFTSTQEYRKKVLVRPYQPKNVKTQPNILSWCCRASVERAIGFWNLYMYWLRESRSVRIVVTNLADWVVFGIALCVVCNLLIIAVLSNIDPRVWINIVAF